MRITYRLLALAAVGSLLLSGCGDDDSSDSDSARDTTTSSAAPVDEGVEDEAAAEAAIRETWTAFFATTDVSVQVTLLEDGEALREAVAQSAEAGTAFPSEVTSVVFLDDSECSAQEVPSPCAEVTYDILDPSGAPVLPDVTGHATLVGDRWLVSRATFCNLVELGGATCPS